MSEILISQIMVTGSQIIAKINDIDTHLESYDLSQLLKHITEKTITILSREYHKHNDLESFRNNYMLTLSKILNNANSHQFPNKLKQYDYPYWVIDDQHWTKGNSFIITTLRNIANEKLLDD